MTTREAIKRIVEHNKIHFEKEKGKCPLITKALEMAVESLEKQIPKKPIYVENITLTDVYKCPCCKKRFTGTSIAEYCYHCGQALDWSDT